MGTPKLRLVEIPFANVDSIMSIHLQFTSVILIRLGAIQTLIGYYSLITPLRQRSPTISVQFFSVLLTSPFASLQVFALQELAFLSFTDALNWISGRALESMT